MWNKIKKPEQLLEFMSENIRYGFVDKDKNTYDSNSPEWDKWRDICIVQTGKQILETKVGTCWDQVELERLWFEKHKYDIKTYFIWFEVDYENKFPSHTFLLYKKKDKWYWFENAFEACRGIHEFKNKKEAINEVINKHLEYAIENGLATKQDKRLITLYEYNRIKASTVNEYLEQVTKNKIK